MPLLKQGVIASILATRNTVVQNEPHLSHEIFGYDFMVDAELRPWLIEVNSSPACDYSTAVTERYVKKALVDILKVTIDKREVSAPKQGRSIAINS